jgi:hypothetical protein
VTRVLGIELRRSAAPWLGVALVVAVLGLTYGLSGPWVHGAVWNRQWSAMGLWPRCLLSFTWPVAVGLGALHGTRQRRSRMTELLATASRPGWQRVAVPATAIAMSLAAAVLALSALGGVQVAAATGRIEAGWVAPALVGLLALVAGALAGTAAGHLVPSLVVPPVAAALALALVAVVGGPDSALPVRLLSPALEFPGTPFTTVAGAVHVGQAVALAGLAVAALLAVGLRRARWAAVLPLVLAVVAGLAILPARHADAYPVDPAATALVCDDAGPRVCVTHADAALLDDLAAVARPALGAFAGLPNAPTFVLEVPVLPRSEDDGSSTRLAAVPPDALAVDLVGGVRELADHDRDRLQLLTGAGTLTCDRYVLGTPDSAARFAVVSWLAGDPAASVAALPIGLAARAPEIVTQVTSARDALLAAPRPEQVRRVAALRAAALDCRDGLWDILVGGAR